MSVEIPAFNERQLEELEKFDHLLNTIGFYETQTDNDMQFVSYVEPSPGKRKETKVFDIDERLIGVLDRTGFNMYRGFMEESTEMKEAADSLLKTHQQLKAEAQQGDLDRVVAIWEASK